MTTSGFLILAVGLHLAFVTQPGSGVPGLGRAQQRVVASGESPDGTSAVQRSDPGSVIISAPVLGSETLSSDTAAEGGDLTTATKVLFTGEPLSLRIQTSPSLAGKSLSIWVAKKSNGIWSAFTPHARVAVGDDGIAYYSDTAGSPAWLSFQARFTGSATLAPAVAPARQAHWMRR